MKPKLMSFDTKCVWFRTWDRKFSFGKKHSDYLRTQRTIKLGRLVIYIYKDYDYTLEEWEKLQEEHSGI